MVFLCVSEKDNPSSSKNVFKLVYPEFFRPWDLSQTPLTASQPVGTHGAAVSPLLTWRNIHISIRKHTLCPPSYFPGEATVPHSEMELWGSLRSTSGDLQEWLGIEHSHNICLYLWVPTLLQVQGQGAVVGLSRKGLSLPARSPGISAPTTSSHVS